MRSRDGWAACVALTVSALLAACTAEPAPDPSAGASSSASPSPAVPTAGTSLVPVYWVLTAGDRPRLVREFHRLTVGDVPGDVARAAASEIFDGTTALDPDYETLWPINTRVRSAIVDGDTVRLDLSGAAVNSVSPESARIAVQQLVWTITAATGLPKVWILLDGKQTRLLWDLVDVSQPIARAAAVDTLSPVWVISPQQDEHVGKEFTLHIAGIAPEATVNYEVRLGLTVVDQGVLTLSEGGPGQGEVKTTVTVDKPGEYVVEAYLVSLADGSRQYVDGHVVSVG